MHCQALLIMCYLGNLLLGDNRSSTAGNEDDDDNDDDYEEDENDEDGVGDEGKEGKENGIREDVFSNHAHEAIPLTPPILLSPFRFRSRPNIPVIPQPAKIHVPATSISLPSSTPVSVPQSTDREEQAQSSNTLRNLDLNLEVSLDQNLELDSDQSPTLRRRPKLKSRSPPGSKP